MAAKLNFFEKLAVTFGPIYRYQKSQFPRRLKMWKLIAQRELAPPTSKEWPAIRNDFNAIAKVIESGAYKNYTLREFLVYAGVAFEVLCWFVAGECIGRRNAFGYLVPANYVSPKIRKEAAAHPPDNKNTF